MALFESDNAYDILYAMGKTREQMSMILAKEVLAGAEYVQHRVESTAPMPELRQNVKVSKVYKTPSDDGINAKVYYSGYTKTGKPFTRRAKKGGRKYTSDKGTPIEFIAMVTEYGTSPRYTDSGAYRGYVGKKPYFRKAFKADEITKVMLDVEHRELEKIWDERTN